mmetsp:Transcript_41393/g.102899  ORF Transcript_41393/g.102899 Transcript_41393/m.102899 type:complete len:405 (-) Transcript_41393:13-1227(-)
MPSRVNPIPESAAAMPAMSAAEYACTKSSMALAVFLGMAPTMPKSMKATRPSLRTSRLPACTSAWNHSLVRTDEIHVLSAMMSTSSGSGVYLRTLSRSVSGTPYSRSRVRMRFDDAERYTAGTVTTPRRSDRSRNCANCSVRVASSTKSVSSRMASRSVCTTSLSSGVTTPSSWSTRLMAYSRSRSACSDFSTPRFCTLITTSSPVRSVAACTCAIDAAARGVCSTREKTDSTGRPSSASRRDLTVPHAIGGAVSRHRWNSRTYSGGKSVGLLAMNCPSLMYVAPSSSKRRRSTSCGGGGVASAGRTSPPTVRSARAKSSERRRTTCGSCFTAIRANSRCSSAACRTPSGEARREKRAAPFAWHSTAGWRGEEAAGGWSRSEARGSGAASSTAHASILRQRTFQ